MLSAAQPSPTIEARPGVPPPTRRQREAIESWRQGDVCVVAGPGSGKTYVLVERFRWLVQGKGIPAHRILAITFTERAAHNMRRRLVAAFDPSSAERKAVERAYISTIHSFCAHLLRENAIDSEVDPDFRVLEEWEADSRLRRAIDEALEAAYRAGPEQARQFLSGFGSSDVAGGLFRLYQATRAAGVSPRDAAQIHVPFDPRQKWEELLGAYREVSRLSAAGWSAVQRERLREALAVLPRIEGLGEAPAGWAHWEALSGISLRLTDFPAGSRQRELLKDVKQRILPACRAALLLEQNQKNREWVFEVLAAADRRYREAKRAAAALDYADLEEGAVRLLEKTGRRLASAFWFILLDEYQDTNPLQARLVDLLRGDGNLFAVGDLNQSIYGFRHADPRVFDRFRERTRAAGGPVVAIEENFRSRPEALAAVRQIIGGAEGVEPQEWVAAREFSRPAGGPCLEILIAHGPDAESAQRLEALHLAARITELRRRLVLESGPAEYRDFAVLARTFDQLRVVEQALRARGIPSQVAAGRGFYETREVRDQLCFLRALLDPADEISLAAVLRSPLCGVSDDALLRLKLASPVLSEGLADAAGLPAPDAGKLVRFAGLLARFRRERDLTPLDRLLARLLAETGYESWLLQQPDGAQRVANVRKLMALARKCRSGGASGLAEFVERAEDLEREQAREAEAQPPDQTADAVRLLTVHAAKGLEFPVVILPAINRGTRSDQEAIRFSPGIGAGIRWRDPLTGHQEPDLVAEAVSAERKAQKREEAERLFYVAMTRAEELLILSASFGGPARSEQWAARLRSNLGIDLKCIDKEPRLVRLAGVPARLLQTNQPPPAPLEVAEDAPPAPPVVFYERPAAVDQADASVSVSSVALFGRCPRRYYLSRYLGWEEELGPDAADTHQDGRAAETDDLEPDEFGRLVHRLLAGLLEPEQAPPEAVRLAGAFWSSPWGRRASAARRIEREYGFVIPLGDRLLRGQIDVWLEDDDGITVIDYKSDQVEAGGAAARAAEYALQARLYAMAVEALTGTRPARAILYFLRPSLAIEVGLEAAALAEARRLVEEVFQAQSLLRFPLRIGEQCLRCPHFQGRCPAAGVARALA